MYGPRKKQKVFPPCDVCMQREVYLSPLLHGFDIIHMNILLLFVDLLFAVADDNTLGVGIDTLSTGIVEDVRLAVALELNGGYLVSGSVSVVENKGEVGIAVNIEVTLDGIRHVLGQLEV